MPWHQIPAHLSCSFHFGRDQSRRSPFGQRLRKKGRPKDAAGQEQQSEILTPSRGSCNELAELELPVTLLTGLAESQEHLPWEQGVHLVKATGLAGIYGL